jgi:magnesium-protoporphyrin O-methyltransferase
MAAPTYEARRHELETYFDRTAAATWARLTSEAPVGRIRATVRAGRDAMRATLLDWLPADLAGRRVLDAGCGTGALAVELARRGADVVAIDLSRTLVDLARERSGRPERGSIDFRTGDLVDGSLGRFDHVVAMDSLIHYAAPVMVRMLSGIAERCTQSILFTFPPRTRLLGAMHVVGRLFPRSDRAPDVEPLDESALRARIEAAPDLAAFAIARTQRIATGFYISQAMELRRR